jgi:hypothetical protein
LNPLLNGLMKSGSMLWCTFPNQLDPGAFDVVLATLLSAPARSALGRLPLRPEQRVDQLILASHLSPAKGRLEGETEPLGDGAALEVVFSALNDDKIESEDGKLRDTARKRVTLADRRPETARRYSMVWPGYGVPENHPLPRPDGSYWRTWRRVLGSRP